MLQLCAALVSVYSLYFGRSLEVAGSVFWGTLGAFKDLLLGGDDRKQQQQRSPFPAGPSPPPMTISTILDRHAAASTFMRVLSAAAGSPLFIMCTGAS